MNNHKSTSLPLGSGLRCIHQNNLLCISISSHQSHSSNLVWSKACIFFSQICQYMEGCPQVPFLDVARVTKPQLWNQHAQSWLLTQWPLSGTKSMASILTRWCMKKFAIYLGQPIVLLKDFWNVFLTDGLVWWMGLIFQAQTPFSIFIISAKPQDTYLGHHVWTLK